VRREVSRGRIRGKYSTGASNHLFGAPQAGECVNYMHIVIGLGNPGREYADTRHNIGFMVLAELARRNSAKSERSRFRAELTEYFANGGKVILAAPQTFMNLSGVAASQIVNWYRAPLDRVLIVHDEIDLPFGQLRMRQTGSAGGHNGLKSIIDELGTTDIPRLRVGVGRGPGTAVAHVLSRFNPMEQQAVPDLVARAADAVEIWIRDGVITAMNSVNQRPVEVAVEQGEETS